MKKLVTLATVLSAASLSHAALITIQDSTAGTAVNDGTIGGGEYVGSSAGVNSGFGGVVGSGASLHVDSSSAGGLNFGLARGAGSLFDRAVLYIDSVAGGFAGTTTFTDTADALRRAISAENAGGSSDLTFATGFMADYAIGFDSGFGGLWQLVGGGSHNFITSVNLNPTGNAASPGFEMDLTLANLGLSPGGAFDYILTYLNPEDAGGPFRSNEFNGSTYAGVNPGQTPLALGADDFNRFVSIPEPSTLAFVGLGLIGLLALRRKRA